MKNILNTTDDLKLFDENRIMRYEFCTNSYGYSFEYTRDSEGKELTYKNSGGDWSEYTRDSEGKELTYKNSDGDWSEYTRDSEGKELTYKNSTGTTRGFDIPEFTMEELVAKLGNFKIKK